MWLCCVTGLCCHSKESLGILHHLLSQCPVSFPLLHLLFHTQLSNLFLFLWLVSAAVLILCEVLHCLSFSLHSSPGDLPRRSLVDLWTHQHRLFAAQKIFSIKSKFLQSHSRWRRFRLLLQVLKLMELNESLSEKCLITSTSKRCCLCCLIQLLITGPLEIFIR